MEDIYRGGNVRAIGVSNFEVNHMEDILELKSFVPSVNQVQPPRLPSPRTVHAACAVLAHARHPSAVQFEFHPYWHEDDLVAYCKNLSILVNGYSPLGARDLSPQRCVLRERRGWGGGAGAAWRSVAQRGAAWRSVRSVAQRVVAFRASLRPRPGLPGAVFEP